MIFKTKIITNVAPQSCARGTTNLSSILGALFFLIATVSNSFALPANEKSPIQVTRLSSDSAKCLRQNNENICIYSGNAKFIQGVTNLQAQKITIYEIASGKVNKIVASGEHSHYSTINNTNDNKKPINADANLITIYPDKKMMVLEGSGEVISGQDKYSGPHIEYQF